MTLHNAIFSTGGFAPIGNWTHDMLRHRAIYAARSDTLVVTFDNSRSQKNTDAPWGHKFIAQMGHSHLGLMMKKRNDWYRHADVVRFFEDLRDAGFFARFRKVLFYGSSKGAYAALAYCWAAPGARVLALCPQSTLDPGLAPWETRFRGGYARGDWSDPRSDAALSVASAAQVDLCYDPYFAPDVAHVARLDAPNVTHMKCPYLRHNLTVHLAQAGLLKPMVRAALDGSAEVMMFRRLRRTGRNNREYARLVLTRALHRGHEALVHRVALGLMVLHPEWNLRVLARKAQARIVGATA